MKKSSSFLFGSIILILPFLILLGIIYYFNLSTGLSTGLDLNKNLTYSSNELSNKDVNYLLSFMSNNRVNSKDSILSLLNSTDSKILNMKRSIANLRFLNSNKRDFYNVLQKLKDNHNNTIIINSFAVVDPGRLNDKKLSKLNVREYKEIQLSGEAKNFHSFLMYLRDIEKTDVFLKYKTINFSKTMNNKLIFKLDFTFIGKNI